MQRRSFLRSSLAVAAAPAAITLPRSGGSWTGPARAGIGSISRPAGPIRLSSNENPLGIPESATAAIRDGLVDANRYPSLDATLIRAIAAKHDVDEQQVILGAGSTDVLRMIAQAIGAGDRARLVLPQPTFEHVEAYAGPYIRDIISVPLAADHSLDVARMNAAARGARGESLVFVCNPNNPTGTITPSDRVEAWIDSAPDNMFFVIDEAYFDFVDDRTYHTLIPFADRPNVLVSRTFSKVYGLAGLRLGYGIAAPATIRRMSAFGLFNRANHVALAAAIACIGDQAFIDRSIAVNRQGRQIAQRTLAELELDALPSHTNFIMHRIRGDLTRYRARMADAGIRVGRAFPPMLDHNRVSIGLPSEMEQWADTLRAFRSKGWV